MTIDSKQVSTIKGQSLVELVIGLGIMMILIVPISTALGLIMRQGFDIKTVQVADYLSQSRLNNLKVISEASWSSIYNATTSANKGPNSQFYLAPTSTVNLNYEVKSGATSTIIDGIIFVHYFSIENVNRDASGNIISTGGTEDPSTQRVAVTTSWEDGYSLTKTQYFMRYRNRSFIQTDWSGGGNQDGPISVPNNKFATSTQLDFTSIAGLIKIAGVNPVQGRLTSSIFDTLVESGAAPNVIMWKGYQPSGTLVEFQIASSNCPNGATDPPTCTSGTWQFVGSDGSPSSYYQTVGPNLPVPINLAYHNNQRFFRYQVYLYADAPRVNTPEVEDVILNWSP